MMGKTKGYVYILTNPSFRNDWVKIGKSSRPVDVRSKELYNTAVPLPFVIFATLKTEKYEDIENNMHEMFEDLAGSRINDKREFFNITPEKAFKYLQKEAKLCDDAEILGPQDYCWSLDGEKQKEIRTFSVKDGKKVKQVDKEGKNTANFKFSLIGLKGGETLTFTHDENLKVKVVSIKDPGNSRENLIEYNGERYSLSGFVKKFIKKKHKTGTYQGPKYFTYKGKTLDSLRNGIDSTGTVKIANNKKGTYYIDSRGIKAFGVERGDKFVILKGSTGKVSTTSQLDIIKKMVQERENLLKKGIIKINKKDNVVEFLKDYDCNTSTYAARLLLLNSVSGPSVWEKNN